MIQFDLKLGLFLLLLALLALCGGAYALARRRAPPAEQALFEQLPFGLLLLERGSAPTMLNQAARQLLRALDQRQAGAAQQLLERLAGPAAPPSAQSGQISTPLPLRWWRYPLDTQRALLLLSEELGQRQQQQLIGQLSHELRTPLTALLAHTEIARSPQTAPAIQRAALDTIEREAQRMARLVRDLIELYRLEVADDLALRPCSAVLVAEAAIAQQILRAEERQIALIFEADSALPPALAHPDRLTQVFVNLLDNAIKYCRPGDTICVRLERRPDGLRCSVRDDGPGIDAADLPHVAERLYRGRAHAGAEGSGMGLALVSEILQRHGSALEIASSTAPPSGTTVAWLLPYAAP